MRVIRGKVLTNSVDDSKRRVKVDCEGLFKDLLIDSVNGLYLRKGDDVFIQVSDLYLEPLIIGRCSGQLELQDLVDIINNLVNVINSNADSFTGHVHTFTGTVDGPVCSGTTAATTTSVSKANKVKPDDLLY